MYSVTTLILPGCLSELGREKLLLLHLSYGVRFLLRTGDLYESLNLIFTICCSHSLLYAATLVHESHIIYRLCINEVVNGKWAEPYFTHTYTHRKLVLGVKSNSTSEIRIGVYLSRRWTSICAPLHPWNDMTGIYGQNEPKIARRSLYSISNLIVFPGQ